MQIGYIQNMLPTLRESIFIREITMRDETVGKLLDNLSEEDEQEVLKLLNSIANQGISSINFYKYSYVIDGVILRFNNLSTSEKLFLISYAANKSKNKTFFCNDVSQLTRKTLAKYLNYFKNSKYVNFVYTDSSMDAYYEIMLSEARN